MMLKKFFAIYLLFICFFCVLSCEKNKETKSSAEIITTNFPLYDFARKIAGDKMKIKLLLPLGAESHSYEPTPQDIIAIQNSKLFIYIGGESDEWVERILKSTTAGKMKTVKMIDSVSAVEEEIVEGMQEESEDGKGAMLTPQTEHDEAEYDEHIWTSPLNAIRMVESIANAICELDSANAEFYRANAASYIAQLQELDKEFKEIVKNSNRKVIVFGDRFPFRYFADEYNLKYFAAFPGCSDETEPSAKTLAFLIDKIKEEKISVIFHIEFSNEKIANTIADATGAKKLLLHSVHNASKSDFDSGKTYVDFMRANAKNLKSAL